MPIPIIIAGKNDIGCNMLKYVIENYKEHQIYVVLNQTEDGVDGWQPSIKKLALQEGIPIISLENAYDIKDCLFLSCEFDKIIKPHLFNTDRLINIHFSKLPEYKGMYTSCLPILHGKRETGVTLHKIDKGIDTGDIIDQTVFPILTTDTALDVYLNYNKYGYELIKKNFDSLVQGTFDSYCQPVENASYYSKKTVDFKNLKVNYWKTANEIKNQIHAYSFVHYQLPYFDDIKIEKAELLTEKSEGPVKQIVEETDEYIIVNSIDYNVKLYKHL